MKVHTAHNHDTLTLSVYIKKAKNLNLWKLIQKKSPKKSTFKSACTYKIIHKIRLLYKFVWQNIIQHDLLSRFKQQVIKNIYTSLNSKKASKISDYYKVYTAKNHLRIWHIQAPTTINPHRELNFYQGLYATSLEQERWHTWQTPPWRHVRRAHGLWLASTLYWHLSPARSKGQRHSPLPWINTQVPFWQGLGLHGVVETGSLHRCPV